MPSSNLPRRLRLGGVLALLIAAVIVAAVLTSHYLHLSSARAELSRATAKGPEVQIVHATASGGMRDITILADVVPYQVATLYGKVSGYLGKVLVDKGDVVKSGQLLATIESQETDAQYASAAVDLANKQQIARRYDQLARQNAIAAQQKDQADADARIAQATLNQDATLKGYERLIAPFSGKVTARYADAGALVQNAQTGQTASLPVVTVEDDSKLRIDAFVQQQDARPSFMPATRWISSMPPILAARSRRSSPACRGHSIPAPAPCWWRRCWTIPRICSWAAASPT